MQSRILSQILCERGVVLVDDDVELGADAFIRLLVVVAADDAVVVVGAMGVVGIPPPP